MILKGGDHNWPTFLGLEHCWVKFLDFGTALQQQQHDCTSQLDSKDGHALGPTTTAQLKIGGKALSRERVASCSHFVIYSSHIPWASLER